MWRFIVGVRRGVGSSLVSDCGQRFIFGWIVCGQDVPCSCDFGAVSYQHLFRCCSMWMRYWAHSIGNLVPVDGLGIGLVLTSEV